MNKRHHEIKCEASGVFACFTRPDSGSGKRSYEVPTYSSVRGILEAVYWSKETIVIPRKVEICSPISFYEYNVNYLGPSRKPDDVKTGNSMSVGDSILSNVCYRIYADIHDKGDTYGPCHKHKEIFDRRIKRGSFYSWPYFGLKEFSCDYIGEFRESTTVETSLNFVISAPLYHDKFFPHAPNGAVFQEASVKNGVLEYIRIIK